MSEFVVKRQFQGLLGTGVAATAICVLAALIFWPTWALISKSIINALAGAGIQAADPKTAAKYIANFAEGTFFFMVINAWVWQILIFGGYGKTYLSTRQPLVGIWYTFVGLIAGALFIFVFAGFLGIWWKPFSLSILLMPKTAEEVHLAIEGWELINFYTLPVLIVQIPFVSLLQKWPFAGNIKAPWDGYGVFMASTAVAILVWLATVFSSLVNLQLGGHDVAVKPFGAWPTYLAFCQAYIWTLLIPAEGGEGYPMKLFAKKQPYMGFVGFIIALAGGFAIPAILRPLLAPLMPGVPLDVVVTSFEISIITFTLLWHHIFDDYPTAQMVPNQATRVLTRIAIWLVGGSIFGVFWLKYFKMIPFGANDLGMGYPAAGPIAGQFVLIMMLVIFNTHFEKWPLVKKVPVETNNSAKA